jgi:hypothetical protein
MAVQDTPTIPSYDVTPAPEQASDIAGNGFTTSATVRGHGTFNAILRELSGVTSETHIFASVSEINSEGFRVQGSASCRVNNVSPFPNQPRNGVLVHLTVDWASDLPLRIDYLIVNG